MYLVVIVLLVLVCVGGLPTWGYHSYGYGLSGTVGLVLVVLLILVLLGKI